MLKYYFLLCFPSLNVFTVTISPERLQTKTEDSYLFMRILVIPCGIPTLYFKNRGIVSIIIIIVIIITIIIIIFIIITIIIIIITIITFGIIIIRLVEWLKFPRTGFPALQS